MIRADHKRWAELIFDPYLGRILKKDFSHFYISKGMPELPGDTGLLVTPNHISWWDGFFIYHCMKRYSRRKIHLMMLEEQLRQFPFFRYLGAYSIDPGVRKAVRESLEYTKENLVRPDSYTVVYPQGEIVPQDTSPLSFQKGIVHILGSLEKPVAVMPVIFLVKPYNERHPEIWCRFGETHSSDDVQKDLDGYEAAANRELELLQKDILNRRYRGDLLPGKK